MDEEYVTLIYDKSKAGEGRQVNTDSVLETIKELRRWEQTTSAIESRIKEVRSLKSKVRERLRSLELTLSVVEEDQAAAGESSGSGL